MGFPESVLTKDEQVVLHLHPHWKALFLPVVWFVLALAAVIAAVVFTGWGMIPLLVVGGIALAVVLVVTVWPWIRWRTTHYVFTNERVIMRSGVFSRSGRDIPLGRVNDVSFSHTLFERMLGCGTLTIESAGERGQVQLTDLPQVEKTQSALYELVDADRQKHTFGDDDRDALVREIKND
ncbi:PH domain-containing protein [Dactylosporangium roseum]|uniref:PH domain-containing protein n=1 Tax=Dactylosporangium roseum TaxID=47989 RepID=A0ABY5ZEU3_9ACTN|nr:PH domain-containing protein [Dactylosporangium roseum]